MWELTQLYTWFREYARTFYTDDEFVMAGIQHKEEHSLRVADNTRALAGQLALNPGRRKLAEAIGLLHDTGRFYQYSRYRTFQDPISIDHGEAGVETLEREGVLDQFSALERDCLVFAIRYHNKMDFPDSNSEHSLFARIIRDADKLDIFRCLAPITAEHNYSSALIDRLLHDQPLPYAEVKTAADKRLIRIGWLFDVNYAWTLQALQDEGHVQRLLDQLPDAPALQEVRRKAEAYVVRKLREPQEILRQ